MFFQIFVCDAENVAETGSVYVFGLINLMDLKKVRQFFQNKPFSFEKTLDPPF